MYEKLVKTLRKLAGEQMFDFERKPYIDAADAIEELEQYLHQLEKLRKEGWYLQKTKQMTYGQATMTMPLPEPPKEEQ